MTEPDFHAQKSDDLSTEIDDFNPIDWRKEKVWELRSMGFTVDKIVDILKAGKPNIRISHGTVYNDLKTKQEEINKKLQTYYEELPAHNNQAVTSIMKIQAEAWRLFAKSEGDVKAQAQLLTIIQSATMALQELRGDSAILQQSLQRILAIKKKLGLTAQEENPEQLAPVPPEELHQNEERLVSVTQRQSDGGNV